MQNIEKESIRLHIKTRTDLSHTPMEIYNELKTALKDKAPSYKTVCSWAKYFREGGEELEDRPRPGAPISRISVERIEQVRKWINENPTITYDELQARTALSRGTIFNIVHVHLELKKEGSCWVPLKKISLSMSQWVFQ